MKKQLFFVLLAGATALVVRPAAAQSLAEGQKSLEIEQFGRAGATFRSLTATSPTAENFYYLGNYYLEIEEVDSARMAFEKGLAADPLYALNRVGTGVVYRQQKNVAEGKKRFDEAITMSKSKDARVLARIARAYVEYEPADPAEAIRLADAAIALDKNNPEYQLIRGDAYLSKNEGGEAVKSFERAEQINPKLAKAYFHQGKVWIRSREYQKAGDLYKKGLEVDPNYGPGYRELAELYYRADQLPKAIENYKKYMQLSDNSEFIRFRYAQFLFLAKDYAGALTELNQLTATSHNPVIHRLKAYALYETDKYAESLVEIETFFAKVDPKKILPSDYRYLGLAQAKTDKDSLGVMNLEKAIAMDTTLRTELLRDIAKAHYEGKRYLKSADTYREAIAKSTKPATQDYFDLGRALYFGKQYALADSAFAKVNELKADFATGYLYRARANSQLDPKTEKFLAMPYYQKYVELTTDLTKYKKELVEAYQYLGYYYMTKKDKIKAREAWNKVLELDPTNEKGRKAAQLLSAGQ